MKSGGEGMKFLSNFKMDYKKLREIDKKMLFSIIFIAVFGIINIYLATKANYGLSYIEKQSLFFILSLVVLYFVLAVDYSMIVGFTNLFYWGSVLLLIATLVLGTTVNGAQGWIRFGPLSLQPAELAKVATIMIMGKKMEELDGNVNTIKNFFKVGIYAIIPAALIVIQPDMGMTMVLFFMVLGVYFIGGLDKKVILGGLGSLLLAVVLLWNSGLIQDYQKTRITSFMNPDTDTSDSGYHLRQSLIGIGSGGFWGVRNSMANDGTGGFASQYVPEVETDFIFAQISEQWGTAGAIVLLTAYGILISRMLVISKNSKDIFGKVVSAGMATYFLFAIMQNIGMTIGLMPITGITLPLVSYGGSSLLTTIVSLGLVLNIGMRKKSLYF